MNFETNINKDNLLKIKEYSHYTNLKQKTHSFLDKIYRNNFSHRPVIGSCSYLYKLFKPTSYEDFLNQYTQYTYGPTPELCGRSIDELIVLSRLFQEKSEEINGNNEKFPKLTFEDYYDLLILHIIIETYDGQKVEEYYREMYESVGCEIELPSEKEDARLGIDFIIKTNERNHFIQVKPRTFITSTSSGTRADREHHFIKEQSIKDKYGNDSRLEFIFYERDSETGEIFTYINKHTNKIRFKLMDICELNGFTKFPSKEKFQNEFEMRKM